MTFTIEESFSNVTIRDIEQLESDIGYSLPSDYKGFLIKHNGGKILPNTFKYASTEGCADVNPSGYQFNNYHRVDSFFGIIAPSHELYTSFSIMFVRNSILADEKTPDDVLPIALTGTGDVIFIKLTGDTVGHVYIWLHEKLVDADDTKSLPDCYNAHFIESSFSNFLSALY